jgi:hypothetical protein
MAEAVREKEGEGEKVERDQKKSGDIILAPVLRY